VGHGFLSVYESSRTIAGEQDKIGTPPREVPPGKDFSSLKN
jgi:hypothetical protein